MTTASSTIDDVFRNDPAAIVRATTEAVERRLADAPTGLVLYGAGHFGRVAANALRRKGIVPRAFVDRDPGKAGGDVQGIPVVSLDHLRDATWGTSLVVVTVYNCVAVLKELRRRGIDAITYAQLAAAFGEPLRPYCGIQDPHVLWENEAAVRAGLGLWADDESRHEYVAQLMWSLHLDPMRMPSPRPAHETYFDPAIVQLGDHEVFVDCGAFDGDSVAAFRARCPRAASSVALEPDPTNRATFFDRFGGETAMAAAGISLLPYAASDRREIVMFDVTGTAGSAIADAGLRVEAAPLDELVATRAPTFIKMDIEGAEPRALAGAAGIMRQHKPRMAVCLYHDRRHLWELPLQISRIQPEYRLHLRRYADECWELVGYASPSP